MLGSVHDAEDALQDALLGAWRGLDGFEGRSSLRTWLYQIATHACLRVLKNRPKRVLSPDYGPAFEPSADVGSPVEGPVWIEPYPDDVLDNAPAELRYELRESVELAFVAALQHLPPNQRAVVILREVLAFPAAEVATLLDTSVASINSALQRARKTLDERGPRRSQQANRRALGSTGERELVEAFVKAWEQADVEAIVAMLAQDARFTMPPLPAWFGGVDDITYFLRHRVFATPWRLVPTRANGQIAFACRQPVQFGSLTVLTLDGDRITELTCFLDPAVTARWQSLPHRPVTGRAHDRENHEGTPPAPGHHREARGEQNEVK
jgi:RNA polymerase sigma-70 factor (ECF subfamily)